MPLSPGFRKITTIWASSPTATRTDPDDSSLTPPLTVADGWGPSFSNTDGDTPRRSVMNEVLWRIFSALVDTRNYGIAPWDAAVDTLMGGVKQVDGVAYVAAVDNGPTYGNATDPTVSGNTVWGVLSGTTSTPSRPDAPTLTAPRSGTLLVAWSCPLDGGAAIFEFDVMWRVVGASTFTTVTRTLAYFEIGGLANGVIVEAQIVARNSLGDSQPSTSGRGTTAGTVPGGGAQFALRADGGDTDVDLDWLVPDDGGETISGYTYQWRRGGQSFQSSRQGTTTDSEATVSGLTNGTGYFFRVRAANSRGDGAWSDEAPATPVAEVVPPTPTPNRVPGQPTDLEGVPGAPLTIEWRWEIVDDDGGRSGGGETVLSYDFQWRYEGNGWSGNSVVVERTCATTVAANATRDVEARVRARNGVGNGPWSSTEPATPVAEVVPPTPTPNRVPGQPTDLEGVPGAPLTIEWRWEIVDDDGGRSGGGETVLDYTFQWRYEGNGWSGNSVVVERTCATTVAANATRVVEARVRARNGEGLGPWSGDADATPVAEVVPPTPTPNTVPGTPDAPVGTARRPLVVDWVWDIVDDDGGESGGGETILSYDFQWRYAGANWSGNLSTVERTCATTTAANATRAVQARVRARNGEGVSGWSGTGEVLVSALLGGIPQVVRVSSDQTYFWPYPDASRAILNLVAVGGAGDGFDVTRNISVSSLNRSAAVTDGTTLWIVRAAGSTQGYNIDTGASDSSRNFMIPTTSSINIQGAAYDGTQLWFIRRLHRQQLRPFVSVIRYDPVTLTPISGGITVIDGSTDSFTDIVTEGTTMWVINNTLDEAWALNLATRTRDTAKDIDLGTGNFSTGWTDGTSLWFVEETTDIAHHYVLATRQRDTDGDIDLNAIGNVRERAGPVGRTVWLISGSIAHALSLDGPTTVAFGGSTYTTAGVGRLWQPITGLALNTPLVIDVDTGGYVDLYPQA